MRDQALGLRRLAAAEIPASRIDTLLLEERMEKRGTGCVTVAVTSGKGGVGKTNFSINLALLLAKAGKKVILFDADLGLANVNILFGINPRYTLLDVVEGRIPLEEVLVSGPCGLSIVPAGSGMEKMANLDSVTLLTLMKDLARLEQACDYLIFDTGAGISRTVRAFVSAAQKQIVVVTPEPSSLADAYATIKLIVGTGGRDIHIVSNMVKSDREGEEVFRKIALLTRRFLRRSPFWLGALPLDKSVGLAVLRQSPVALSEPNSPFARALSRIVLRLTGAVSESKPGFFDRFVKIFRQDNDHGQPL
ncbi:MAG: MinD/ParA family protein [Fibrobacterota bacterium]